MSLADKLTTIAENVPKVFEAGEKNGLAMFWDGITANGTRQSFAYALGYYYMTEELLSYPITIQPTNASYMFQNVTGGVDLWEIEKNGGVKFDFSKCTNFQHAYRASDFLKVGVIDGTSANALDYIFYVPTRSTPCPRWVEKLIVKETHTFSNSFRYNADLEHIIFEGVIGNPLDMGDCNKLDKASVESIVNCLSAKTSGLSVTLSKTAVNKAFETSEGANDGSTSTEWATLIATKSNCTISLV